MSDVLKNIITFGGHNKVQNAMSEFEEVRKKLKDLNAKLKKQKEFVNFKLNEITDLKIEAVKTVKKINKITSQISIKDREVIERNLKGKDYSLVNIENNLSISEELINLGKSTFQGVAISGLAVGATWSAVGALATASTGTVISTLSGAAATNATLAWFGGGSLATGGLGMAGGTAVLGGLVAVPAIIIIGLIQYKGCLTKVKEIQEKKIEAIAYIDQINQNLITLNAISMRSDEYIECLNKAIEVFKITFRETYRKVYRFGIVSKLYKKLIHKLFNKKMFNENDLLEISHLGKCTSDIMKIIDTKIL
jgi:hypothetical protein